jgi:hypothetical protein
VSVRNPENPGTFFISRALAPEQVTKADIPGGIGRRCLNRKDPVCETS